MSDEIDEITMENLVKNKNRKRIERIIKKIKERKDGNSYTSPEKIKGNFKKVSSKREEIKIMRISVSGDWRCNVCHEKRWSHYGIKIGKKLFYVCKDCMEKAPFTRYIREFETGKKVEEW